MTEKIVIDTNILVNVVIGDKNSSSRMLFRKCLRKEYQPLMSNALFNEYCDVLNRKSIIEFCPLDNEEKTKLLSAFMSVCQWVKVYYLWRPNLLDEADNYLIELAIAGNASKIITRNLKDFRQSQLKFPQLEFKTPEQLLGD
jgi:putative PIN family toxin of toxin-antitoxin system